MTSESVSQVERTETVYTYAALSNSPLSFTTIAGTVVAECYAARGLVIDRGWVTAGDPVQTSVFFTPSDVCGDRPLEPPNLRVTWGATSSSQPPYTVDCAGGDATAGVLDCALLVIEPMAGEYELRVELDGVLIGCAGEYLDCANPFAVTVAPRPPVAANSRLRAPATHVLTAGVNTSTEVTMDVYLADQFGNKLVPDLPGVGGGWTGPSVVFTSSDVAAPVYASVRYSGNPGVWLVHTDQLTVAGAIYTISASFYLVEEAEHVRVPSDTGQGAPKISVVPALAAVEFFVFSGSGTAPSLSADTHAAVTVALYDRFRNRVLEQSELHFWSVNAKVAVSMFGSVTPEPQYSASPYVVGDRTLRIPFNITTVGTYAVAVSFPDEATRTFYTAAAFRTVVAAGALDAPNALAWDLPLVRGTLAGRQHQFRMRLRDRYGNVLVAGQPVSFLGSALVGRATGAVVAYDAMEIFNLDNMSLAVRFSTNVADVYDVRMVIDSVAAEQVPAPTITISAAAVDPATSTVAASELAAAVAGAPLRLTVFPRDAYRNVIRAGSAEDDELAVQLYVRDALELFQSQALVQRTFDEASGGFTYAYTPTLAGAVRLVVAVGEVPVGTSPFPGVVRPAPTSAAHSTLVGPGVAGAVKEIETYITITARDAYGNVNSDGRDLFRVAFVEGDAAGLLALTPQSQADGLTATGEYLVTYTIPIPQTYTLTVDLPVGGGRYEAVGTATAAGASGRSPLLIEVRSANTPFSAIRCVVSGEGLARAVAGRKSVINVTAVDTEGVPMVSGGRTLRFKLDNQHVRLPLKPLNSPLPQPNSETLRVKRPLLCFVPTVSPRSPHTPNRSAQVSLNGCLHGSVLTSSTTPHTRIPKRSSPDWEHHVIRLLLHRWTTVQCASQTTRTAATSSSTSSPSQGSTASCWSTGTAAPSARWASAASPPPSRSSQAPRRPTCRTWTRRVPPASRAFPPPPASSPPRQAAPSHCPSSPRTSSTTRSSTAWPCSLTLSLRSPRWATPPRRSRCGCSTCAWRPPAST